MSIETTESAPARRASPPPIEVGEAPSRASRAGLARHYAAFLVLLLPLLLQFHLLWDSDSYYHLAVARLYAQQGPAARIPWLRFSVLANGGDKDLLFHLLLAPFAALPQAPVAGRVALALLGAGIATAMAALAVRALGPLGYAVPLWVWVTAPPFFARIVRLRPELLALLLVLVAIPLAARRRALALGVVGLLFALGYTAFHVFLALCVLWFAAAWVIDRRPAWELVGWPLLGVTLGLLLRPHPLANLEIWATQNVGTFVNLHTLDISEEMQPPHGGDVARACAAWALGLLAVGLLRWQEERGSGRRLGASADAAAPFALLAAGVFAVLYTRFLRMSTYFFPLVTLAVLLAVGRPRRHGGAVLLASGLLALPLAADPMLVRLLRGEAGSEREWAAFGAAVPDGAKVACDWAGAELYAFWAPQGRYLNVFDPTFMAVRYPRQYAAQRALFAGLEPDVPAVAHGVLDSDYLAFDRTLAPRALQARVANDPRFEIVYGGYNVLARLRPSDRFVLGWRLASPAGGVAAAAPPVVSPGPGSLAAFVDASAAAGSGCVVLQHEEVAPAVEELELAPWGPSQLAVDGRIVAGSDRVLGAVLGAGPRLTLPAGAHRLAVRTCAAAGRAGFYLLRR